MFIKLSLLDAQKIIKSLERLKWGKQASEKRIADLEEKLANADYQLEGRDNEIRELEAQIEKMKCCGNCGNERCTSKYRGNSAYHRQADGFACADNEDWKLKEIKEK